MHHLLGSYRKAVWAVLHQQLSGGSKAFEGSGEGGAALLVKNLAAACRCEGCASAAKAAADPIAGPDPVPSALTEQDVHQRQARRSSMPGH